MYALHMESTTIYRLVEETFFEHEKCGLTGIDFLYMIDPWVVIQKRLPYKEMIKVKYVYSLRIEDYVAILIVCVFFH